MCMTRTSHAFFAPHRPHLGCVHARWDGERAVSVCMGDTGFATEIACFGLRRRLQAVYCGVESHSEIDWRRAQIATAVPSLRA